MRYRLVSVFMLAALGSCKSDDVFQNQALEASGVGIGSQPVATRSSAAPQETALYASQAGGGAGFVGRFVKEGDRYSFNWSGSRIIARVKGARSVAIGLSTNRLGSQKVSFNISIDGRLQPEALTLSPNTTLYVLNLPDSGEHRIDWVKRTEAGYANDRIVFSGISLPNGGEILAPPAPASRRIEMIGASMTNGYGTRSDQLGISQATTCPNDGSAEDSDLSFGALTAQALKADYTIIAYQGRGVLRNYPTAEDPNGTAYPTLGALWPFTLASTERSTQGIEIYDHGSLKPDVVVINLGTNDFAPRYGMAPSSGIPNETQFVQAYINLLRTVRAKLPQALIVPTFGTMASDTGNVPNQRSKGLAFVRSAIRGVNDPKVTDLVDFGVQPSTGQACSYHPSAATHKVMAAQLTQAISARMNWGNESLDLGKTYSLVSRNSGRCLDVSSYGLNNGALIQQWDCKGESNQKFRLLASPGATFQLMGLQSNRCVSIEGAQKIAGATVHQWQCLGDPNQRFTLVPGASGTFKLKFVHSDKCLGVEGASKENGKRARQVDCSGNAADQDWSFKE